MRLHDRSAVAETLVRSRPWCWPAAWALGSCFATCSQSHSSRPLVGAFTLSVLFAPLDLHMRHAVKVHGSAAALTSAIVALIVVVPTILVVGALLSETNRNARSIGSLIDAETWTRAIEARPRLSPILRAINERFDIPELVKAATGWLAGLELAPSSKGSFTGLISQPDA